MKHNSEPATRQSFSNVQPLPQQRATLSFERSFTEAEYEQIGRGVIPESMDDRWFIFLEDDVLYFHRSWTGFCIYQVRLKKEDAQYRVVEALVNRDATQFSSTDDAHDVDLLTFVIEDIILRGR